MTIFAVGVTTCVQRRHTLLPGTLASLRAAGFQPDRLFVDGCNDYQGWRDQFGVEVTCRYPHIRTYGNWVLGLAELLVRHPRADRYAMFQDDFVAVRNLRAYLERVPYQQKTYENLYLMPKNAALKPAWLTSGFFPSDQRGKGAVALVFDRDTVMTLLTHQKMIERPLTPVRGMTNVDGGVVNALRTAGWTELVHAPSLVQHTGLRTSMRDFDRRHPASQPAAPDFPGEQFDALTLLDRSKAAPLPEGWRREVNALKRAIAEDRERQRRGTPRERHRLGGIIANYQRQLAELERIAAAVAPEGAPS